jgi:hypothetical protein
MRLIWFQTGQSLVLLPGNRANLRRGEATSVAIACCASPQSRAGTAQRRTHSGHEFYSCFPLLESIEVTIKPKPNPESMLPTNARADSFRKKNPTPRPRSRPPPIAHVLLSTFLSVIESSLVLSSLALVRIFHRTTLS